MDEYNEISDDELTPDEEEALEELGYGYPRPEEKQNIFSFFKRVIIMKDTTRTSNLNEDELGLIKVPVRTLLNLSLYSGQMGLSGLGNYFFQESQIVSNSSLSREGFLDKLAVTQKREMEARTRRFSPAQKKRWFKPKEQQPMEKYY